MESEKRALEKRNGILRMLQKKQPIWTELKILLTCFLYVMNILVKKCEIMKKVVK